MSYRGFGCSLRHSPNVSLPPGPSDPGPLSVPLAYGISLKFGGANPVAKRCATWRLWQWISISIHSAFILHVTVTSVETDPPPARLDRPARQSRRCSSCLFHVLFVPASSSPVDVHRSNPVKAPPTHPAPSLQHAYPSTRACCCSQSPLRQRAGPAKHSASHHHGCRNYCKCPYRACQYAVSRFCLSLIIETDSAIYCREG
jgi:hypothetical protein